MVGKNFYDDELPRIEKQMAIATDLITEPKKKNINWIAREVHLNAIEKGWWETDRPIPEILALIHSEVSEALEAYRKFDNDNFAEELADTVIRIFDLSVKLGIDIEKEIIKKHEFNKTRPYRHGGKRC